MPAYVIADIDVQDAEKFEEYKWWSSQNYAGAKTIRQSCAKSNFIVVEGL